MWRTILVIVGGSIGAVSRYWLAGLVQRLNGTEFPLGTLSVNLLGSFAVGVVMALSLERGLIGAELRLLLAVGFCGGFTTMSTFGYETLVLLHDGDTARALGNVGLTVVGSVAAVWMGMVTARVL
jgi:CrcB protein